ncbi:flagellar biosynthesis repressor FlbT [Terasakiella pusilla]|uniref:flagellar biosynthesis repressor FlbT n=1 Tax=Terasakiella pusilla TaxID=64973 RepID=UPI00048F90F8|nr:flagellar biosynthesis repressor FlbT [Terasakiella pusilla]
MPLKLNLKKGQKIIINGAVLENTVDRSVSLMLLNDAAILRDNDILTAEEASTPASRVYYSIQCAYLFENERVKHLADCRVFLEDFLQAIPSSQPIGDEIEKAVEREEYYVALRAARKLIDAETGIIKDNFGETV